MPPTHALLLDFDGLLADYDHRRFLHQLAAAAGCEAARLDRALRADALELAHARGELDGGQLLGALNAQLGSALVPDHWHAARRAATTPRRDCLALLGQLRDGVRAAVLTNNGMLTLPVIEQLLPATRVIGSATLGIRKPEPAAFHAACDRLGCLPGRTLFVDHLFRNVRGARVAGLQADTAHHAQSLRRLLRRHHLLD